MEPKRKLLYIGNKLSKKGSTITSIETLGEFLKEEGFSVLTFSTKKNKIFRMLDMLLGTFVNRNNTSFVLIDTYSTQNFQYAVAVASLCRLFKIPYIPILRGGNLPERLKKSKKQSKKLFGGAYKNVAPSKYLLKSFEEDGYKNLIYIPNTIQIEKYPFKLRDKVSLKLLWVRSFSEIYNPLLALEVVEMLNKKGLDVQLCMVGPDKDGSLERCEKIADERKLPITFTGLLKKEAWIELSKVYDMFINTTNFDNTPISVMEAMALGLPVVSTNVGGLPFLIEDNENGILVSPNNPKAFVNAIEALYNNPLKAKEMAINARSKMEEYDWQEIKHKWIALLDV